MTAPTLNLDAMVCLHKFDTTAGNQVTAMAGGSTGPVFSLIANAGGADRIRAENSLLYTTTTTNFNAGEYLKQELSQTFDLTAYTHIACVIEFDEDEAYRRSEVRPANHPYDKSIFMGVADTLGNDTYETYTLNVAEKEPITVVILPITGLVQGDTGSIDYTSIDEFHVGVRQRESAGGPIRAIFHSAWAFNRAELLSPNRCGVSIMFDDQDVEQRTFAYDVLNTNGLLPAVTLFINPSLVGNSGRMTWAQIQEFYDGGACILPHGMTHFNNDVTSTVDALAEYEDCHNDLQSRGLLAGNVCKGVAYPFGRTDKDLYEALLGAGYVIGRGVAQAQPASPYENSQFFNQVLFPEVGPRGFMYLRTNRLEELNSNSDTAAEQLSMLDVAHAMGQNSSTYGHDFVSGTGGGDRQFSEEQFELYCVGVADRVAAGTAFHQTMARGPDSYAAQMGYTGVGSIYMPVYYRKSKDLAKRQRGGYLRTRRGSLRDL